MCYIYIRRYLAQDVVLKGDTGGHHRAITVAILYTATKQSAYISDSPIGVLMIST